MSAYYQDEHVTVIHGDVREAGETGETGAALVLADPPYQQTGLAWDRWPHGWPAAVAASSAPNASLFCFGSLRMFMIRRDEFAGWKLAQDRVWEKANGSGPCQRDRFNCVHEMHVHFYREGAAWGDVHRDPDALRVEAAPGRNVATVRRSAPDAAHRAGYTGESPDYVDNGTRQMRSVMQAASVRFRGINPTEKPVSFILPAVRYACPPDGVVLVPFAGSGAEVEAAILAGCRVVAYDLREDQCEATARRVLEVRQRILDTPPSLFEGIAA